MSMENMKYRHIKTGNIYQVVIVANKGCERADFPETVVYKNAAGVYFARPLVDFSLRFEKVIEEKAPKQTAKAPVFKCKCAHWQNSSFYYGDTFTCSDCGGQVTI